MMIGVPNRVLNLMKGLKAKAFRACNGKLCKMDFQVVSGNEYKLISFLSYFLLLSYNLFLPSATLANPDPPMPMFENVNVGAGFKPDPRIIRGISGGTERARNIARLSETPNGPCVGFVARNPSHTLVLNSPFNYLRLQVKSPDDTTIVIAGPGGTWCNDDYDGKNAGIAGQWLPGTYNIWVGSYQKDKYTPYIIQITEVQ